MATLRELAERTGYSPATISRILTGAPALAVSEEARKRVLEEAGRLNYAATKSRRGRSPKHLLRVAVAEMLSPAQQLRDEYADTILSMLIGWAINSAMILLAAATFFVSKTPVEELQQADSLLRPLLGSNATVIFAVALLFAGIASTITSGMAAGSIFAGIFKEPYDIKDSHSRLGVIISLVVAFLIILVITNPFRGLIYSQMILSIQLPFTVFLQVYLTSSERVMGKYKNSTFTKYLLYAIGGVVTLLNVMLLVSMF